MSFQFDCRNTLNDQLLENVRVELESADDATWNVGEQVPLPSLPYSQVGSTYVLVTRLEEGEQEGSFSATLKFQVRDVDPATGEPESDEFYEDSYAVSDLSQTSHSTTFVYCSSKIWRSHLPTSRRDRRLLLVH